MDAETKGRVCVECARFGRFTWLDADGTCRRSAEHGLTLAQRVSYAALMDAASKIGTEQGLAAASWFFDGNTPRETYANVLKGIEDGDPETLDALPFPDLSGQWADEPTAGDVFLAICDEAGVDVLGARDAEDDAIRAYEEAFSTAALTEVERVCNVQLAD